MKQKLRKPVAWLLILAMLFTMLPGVTVTALATESTPTLVTNENRGTFGLDASYVGYYALGDADDLFWFANHVNTVDRAANAVLTADIDLDNEPWTPIGSTGESSHNFRGHFDGRGYTITGLKVEGGRAGLGFFGEVRTGTVENFTIYGEVNVTGSHDYVGGVIGSVCGLNSSDHGLKRNGATIRNITSYVDLTAGAHGIGMVGGFIGYANHETLIENCAWYGTFDAGKYRVDSGAGGFVGRIYDTATVTIRNCAAYGTVKTAYQSGTFNNQATIYIGGFLSYSPANAKTVLENNLWAGQIINNTNLTAANAHLSAYGTMNSDASKTNCYALEGTPYVTTNNENKGGITTVTAEQLKSGEVAYKLGSAWGQTVGSQNYPVLGGKTVHQVKNCKKEIAYSNTNADIGHIEINGFCSVCDTLLCDHSGNENQHTDCTVDLTCSVCSTVITEAKGTHTPSTDDGDCTTAVQCTVCGTVTTPATQSHTPGTDDGDCTTAVQCTVCGTVTTPAAQSHTPGTDDGDCTTAVPCSVCGTAVVAAKEHAFGSDSKCTNDGCTAIGYMLWVGCEQFTSKKLTINGGEGTATYDPANNILTLDGYTYEGAGHTWNEPYGDGYFMQFGAAICYGGTDPIRLVLNGESTVVHTGTSNGVKSCGIYTKGSIEILDGSADGIGSLTAKGGPTMDDYSCGVYARGCSINVTSGSLTAIGGTAKYGNGYGMYVHNGSIEVTGGSLTGIGGEAYNSTGVWADKDIVISGSGTVVATGGDSNESSRGVATYDSIQVTGGSLTATRGKGMGDVSYGVYASDGLTMGTGYGIVTPVGGKFDGEQRAVVDADGNYATEVKIAEKPVTYYDLWVGGVQVTSEKLTISGTSGTAAYDPEDNILTLDSYTYEGVGYNDAAIYYGGGGTLKLALVNDNTVTHIDATNTSYGIHVDNGSITISGDCSLTVTADDTPSGQSMSNGIFVSSGDLTILGGTVTATGGKASGSYSADSFGIYVRGMITISGGTVTATGGEVVTDDDTTVGGSSDGICAYGGIHISGGEVNATGGEAYGDSSGVSAHSGLTLGEGIGILTPVGGYFDDGSGRVVDAAGNIARTVRIAEMPDPVNVQLELTKEFNNWGKADGFTFNLAAVTENAPMPASPSATATESAPLVYFGEITFTAAGIYEYTITEVNSGIPGVTYDTSAHEVVVTIENTEDNKLIAEVTYDGGLSLTITNTYTEATLYDLWIGGTQVTSHNAADVFGDGTVSYDAIENTLTLNGYTYTGAGYTWGDEYNSYGAAIYYGGTETLNLILKGESTVTHTGNENLYLYRSHGLYAIDDVVVTEDGDGGSLTITGSVASQESYGVYFQDDYNDNYETVGGSLTLNSGSLTVTGGEANGRSCGVRAYSITVTGGSLTANGGTAVSFSLGADTFGGSITVTGGSLTGNGGDASSFSYGVSVGGYDSNLTVTGGSLTAISGTAGVNSNAVSTHGLTMDEGFGILTPTGGRLVDGVIFDAEGTYATEVEIGAGYTVTAAFDSVDEKNVGGTVTGTGVYRAGTEVTLTVTPDLGCSFVSLTMNGTDVTNQVENGQYTFTMPAGNVAVTVTMERLFTPYDLWVGGEQFTDKKLTVNGTTGTATYDLETNTLTLDGYTYAGAGHTWEEAGWDDTPIHYGAAIYYSGTETLNLVLNGENTVTHTGSADMSASYGLYAKGNIVVSADSLDDSLTVTGGTAKFESHGVCLKFGLDENLMHVGGELTINSGRLTAIAGAAQQNYGVYANTSITVSGSLTATGGTAEYTSYGVYLMDHNGTITVSGSLTATGDYCGVNANGSITVSGSLTANGGDYGVGANGGITVLGSLHATSGQEALSGKLTLGDGIGILTPVGGRYDEDYWRVYDADGNIATEVRIAKSAPKVTLTDGKLTVTNTSVEADDTVDMTIMVAGYTGGKMTRCQVIENVTGVTEVDLTVTGDTIKVFFLNPDTYAPLFAYAEP